ncbi:hypothetical protein GCM10010994_39580 [Chelatococcus reniformis]|uniref:Uncharacterized protein n=1 Tax=Chelatococcus reniformis TaxID=1494448 RepID=A0A916UMI0_9HYPH|nr:hypothetical protein GCM10010994_39580 [Chelatococcus reniformis]
MRPGAGSQAREGAGRRPQLVRRLSLVQARRGRPHAYAYIRLRFVLGGVELATARELVGHFTGTCPIYNTLRRGGPIEAEVEVAVADG